MASLNERVQAGLEFAEQCLTILGLMRLFQERGHPLPKQVTTAVRDIIEQNSPFLELSSDGREVMILLSERIVIISQEDQGKWLVMLVAEPFAKAYQVSTEDPDPEEGHVLMEGLYVKLERMIQNLVKRFQLWEPEAKISFGELHRVSILEEDSPEQAIA